MKRFSLAVLVAAVATVAPVAAVRAEDGGCESPQAVCKKGEALAKEKKTGEFVNLFQPKDRNLFAFSMVFGASFVAQFSKGDDAKKEFSELLKKHKVDESKL